MKHQIIEFYYDFCNSDMKSGQYAEKKNMTIPELDAILNCGRTLTAPNKWLSDKQLIERTLVDKNLTIVSLCELLRVHHAEINEVLKLKRGLTSRIKRLIAEI